MKAIPSLVATSTVGAAATGLVFGKTTEQSAPARSTSTRIRTKTQQNDDKKRSLSHMQQHPTTNSTLYTQSQDAHSSTSLRLEQSISRTSPPPFPTSYAQQQDKRGSTARRHEFTPMENTFEISRKDSMSSRGSWYKRLSSLQMSQSSDSPRSSLSPDSPSLDFSYTSVAPILNTSQKAQSSTAPNKLVKRTYSGKESQGNGARSKMPTLRRPATSHQRSVTLQQRFKEQETMNTASRSISTPDSDRSQQAFGTSQAATLNYRHYFLPQSTGYTKDNGVNPSRETNVHTSMSFYRRVPLPQDFEPPILTHAHIILDSEPIAARDMRNSSSVILSSSNNSSDTGHQSQANERPKRSLSQHLHRLTRGGSMRNGEIVVDSYKRYPSAPITSEVKKNSVLRNIDSRHRHVTDPQLLYRTQSGSSYVRVEDEVLPSTSRPILTAHTTSPTMSPSIHDPFSVSNSLSSSRHIPSSNSSAISDLPKLLVRKERSKSAVMPSLDTKSLPTYSTRVRSMTSDRASMLNVPDSAAKDLITRDDDSEYATKGAFDSYKTTRTGSTRARSPMLESLFDTSPISATDYSSTRTASDYVNTPYRDAANRIVEEDENMATPKRRPRFTNDDDFATPTKHAYDNGHDLQSSPPNFSLATQKCGRLSFDDDEEDEDWTKDDEFVDIEGSLSPPSTFSSIRINSAVRMALASTSVDIQTTEDRPKSVFDWSETTVNDKQDAFGGLPRPRTVHGKQVKDGRGGRTNGRARPNALHVRSQSVPVVPLAPDNVDSRSKKFGTWGLGAKGVSEDWDNDFDFDIDEDDCHDGDVQLGHNMVVPESIQASQASVVGHVGQIREVCLLVEDLKRLRYLGKEKGILNGQYATFWRQADGIIALAAPDEEAENPLSSPHNSAAMSPVRLDSRESSYDSASENEFNSPISMSHGRTASRRLSRLVTDSFRSRRGSAFSPDDNIFGIVPSIEESTQNHNDQSKAAADFARFVMEDIHSHRAVSDPQFQEASAEIPDKMPFDTTSLRDLVARASALSRTLADIIRSHDGIAQSPSQSPFKASKYMRDPEHRESSPAFVRVFTPDLTTPPPPPLPRSQSHNTVLSTSGSSSSFLSESPTRTLQQRMRLMTVI